MLSENQLERASQVLRALGHPLRLGVIQSLVEGDMNVSELTAKHGCSQPMMSQQLQILERQGLIECRKEGTHKFCAIRNRELLRLFECMKGHVECVLQVTE